MKIFNKLINVLLVLSFLLTLFPMTIKASEYKTGVVASTTGAGIRVRSGAGKSYKSIDGFEDGMIVKIIDEVLPTDGTNSDCSKWYKILHSSENAYVCADLIRLVEITENPEYNYEEELSKFPESYKSYINALHEIYPAAMFIATDATNTNGTKMDFNTAVSNEVTEGKSLIWDTYPDNTRDGLKNIDTYNVSTNSFKNTYPGGGKNWYAANYNSIAYYMDPRNFLNEKRIFMFEGQSYNSKLQTIAGIENILAGSYMAHAKIDNSDKTFADAIMDAAIYSGVSPYFLASRILQEVGTTRSALVLGTYTNYPEFNGYYNYYNIGASGTDVVYAGLLKAKSSGWDSEYKAIVYGSSWIGNNYINSGQDTGYFQKWDIKCGGNSSCYSHQYMQNIEAPYSEALSTYNAYKKVSGESMYLNPYVFYIPVYQNMPTSTTLPSTKSPINYLSSITINNNLITNFDPEILEYSVTVSYDTTSIKIEASSLSGKATISGTGSIAIKSNKQDIVLTVTAENGDKRIYTIHVTKEEKKQTNENTEVKEDVKPIVTLDSEISKISGLRIENNIISGITNMNVLKEKFKNSSITVAVKDKDGKVVTSGNMGTGYKLVLSLNNESKEYSIIIYGDSNGDTETTILDLLRIQKHLLKSITITGIEQKACDVNKDGEVNIMDLLLVQKHLLGSKYIEQ